MEGRYPIIIDDALAGTLEVTKKGAMTVFDARCKGTDALLRLSVYGDDSEGYLGVMVPEGGEMRLRRSMSPLSMRGFPEEIVAAGPAGRGNAGQQGVAEETAAPVKTGGGEKREAAEPQTGREETMTDCAEKPETVPAEKPREECGEAAPCEADCGETVSPTPSETGDTPGAEETETPCDEKCPEPEETQPPCEKPPEQQKAESPCEKKPEPEGMECEQKKPDTSSKAEGAPEDTENLCWYASPDGALVCFDGVHSLIALPPADERVPQNIPGQPRQIEGRNYLVYVTQNGRIVS